MLHIIGGSAVTTGQQRVFRGDVVRIVGDLTLFRSGRVLLHLDATEEIALEALQIAVGSLRWSQGMLSIAGEKVTFASSPDILRQGVTAVQVVSTQRIVWPRESNIVQATPDGLVIHGLSPQTITMPQGQVILEIMGEAVALTKGTIRLPESASGNGTLILTIEANTPSNR